MEVCPLVFEPVYKERLWGGTRLASVLGKSVPPGATVGESWEIVDLDTDRSTVARGPARGLSLPALMERWGARLTGRASLVEGRFPLLIKFLDARQTLSVQVHPTEEVARRMGGDVRVKHEAWYVIDAEPDGFIYRGFVPGTDEAALRAAIQTGTVESVLRRIPVRKGDCYYLPSGTVHALGAGVLVAEVQTPSDTTFRLYDFDRVDPATGQPRPLHVEQALECVSYADVPAEHERRSHVASVWTAVTRLVACEAFVIERVRMIDGVEQPIPYDEMVVWIVLEGRGEIAHAGSSDPLTFGAADTVLIPAGLKEGRVCARDNCLWLEVTAPVASSLGVLGESERAELRAAAASRPPAYVPLTAPRPVDEDRPG
ncbi:MAG: class I mannose-6-phosphate isomerase [Phycisphaerales bacterium]|nr:MAG: class I mannose-6-phosphate isomerase [Phycisphaerales bacterium]